jgi:hypothetical protein
MDMLSRKHGLTPEMTAKLAELTGANLTTVRSNDKATNDDVMFASDLHKSVKSLLAAAAEEDTQPEEIKPKRTRSSGKGKVAAAAKGGEPTGGVEPTDN